MQRGIFLDRDGVLNQAVIREGKPYPPASLEELRIFEEVPGALAELRAAGFLLVGATNQPDVARGLQRAEVVRSINDHLCRRLRLLEILTCYHNDSDGCDCRKPAPGLLLAGARKWGIDLHRSFMVVDRWRDIEAGRRAGCRTVFIDRHYREKSPEGYCVQVSSMREAAEWILNQPDS